MSEKDRIEQQSIETVLTQSKKTKQLLLNAHSEALRLRKIADMFQREKSLAVYRADSLSRQLNAMLAQYPLDQAPEECKPYTEMVTKCQQQVAELEQAVSKGDSAVTSLKMSNDTLKTANVQAVVTIAALDSSLASVKEKLKPKKFLGFIPVPSRFLFFVAGVLGGALVSK